MYTQVHSGMLSYIQILSVTFRNIQVHLSKLNVHSHTNKVYSMYTHGTLMYTQILSGTFRYI